MKRTLQQLVTQTRTLIGQTDSNNSDFTDAELTGFLNESLQITAEQIEWPRDLFDIQVEQGKPAYTLPSDTMKILLAFFGDLSISNDVFNLPTLEIQQLTELNRKWLDQSSAAQGQPVYCTLLDRQTLLINPTPDATNSVAGKKLHVLYVYYPAAMANNPDNPDLPDIFHDQIKLYAGYLCYMGKLKNPVLATALLKQFLELLKELRPQVENQFNEKFFSWGNYEDNRLPSIANLQLQ